MALADLAAVGSCVSGVAVVVTLGFLLLQLRQANRNQRAAMQQGRSARMFAWIMRVSEPEMSALTARLFDGETELTSTEAQSFGSSAIGLFWHIEDSFLQHRGGTLDELSWATDQSILRSFLRIPAFRVAWTFNRTLFSGPYRAYVDGLIEEIPPRATFNMGEIFTQRLKAEQARI